MHRTAGYTNHWVYYATAEHPEGGFTNEQWDILLRRAKAIIADAAAEGIVIAGPTGTGRPVVNGDEITLNGDASTRDALEAFHLPRVPSEEDRRFHQQFLQFSPQKSRGGAVEVARGFCKTNGKPYDAVVASILSEANRVGRGIFKATTDDGAVRRVFANEGDLTACWEGYEAIGMKEKDGRQVPNCVPTKTAAHRLDGVRGHQLLPATVARKLPAIYSQENVADPIAQVKLFSPYTNAVWYLTEYDPSSNEAFGWADLGYGMGELGYISIPELEGLNRNGLPLVERDTSWRPVPLSRAKGGRTAASASRYPSVARQVEEDYARKAITSGERRELLDAIENAESRQDAERVVEQHRKGRTASTRVAYDPPFHNAAKADEALGEAYRSLIDLKLGFDSWHEIPQSAWPLYKEIMKAIGLVGTARQTTNQVREMVARKRY